MKFFRSMVIFWGVLFGLHFSAAALADHCAGKTAKACAAAKGCKWTPAKKCVAGPGHMKNNAKKAVKAKTKAAPTTPPEAAPEDNMHDEGEAGDTEEAVDEGGE